MSTSISLARALRMATDRLAARPELQENARRDAQQLLEIATGLTRVQMLAAPERPLSDTEATRLEGLLRQRLQSVPIQYLRGSQDFYGRSFLVTPDVLIPRPETELLIDEVLRLTLDRNAPVRIADVGTGSGVLAITLALELPAASVVALDISSAALAVAQRNAQALAADPVRLRFLHSDLLVAAPDEPFDAPDEPFEVVDEQFDLIVSNPPYVPLTDAPTLHPQVRDYEPHLALFGGSDGHEVLRRLIPQAWDRLRPGGWLLLETAGRTALLDALLADWSQVHYCHDLRGVERIAVAQRPVARLLAA